jgi:hypothetical protein
MEDRFTKLAPIHELGELQQNTLLLTALSTSDAEEGIDFGRRRRCIARSSARAGSSSSRYLGLFLLPKGRPGRHFADSDEEATRVVSFGLFLLWGQPHPYFYHHASVTVGITSIRHQEVALSGKEKP